MDINNITQKVNMVTDQNKNSSADKVTGSGTDFDSVLKKVSETGDEGKLREVCDQFESIFINMMFKNLRETQSEDTLIPKGQGQKIFEGMMDEELSNEMAKSGGFGISDVMYQQLSKQYGIGDEATENQPKDSPKKSFDMKG